MAIERFGPPIRSISAEEHVLHHPEDIKYTLHLEKYEFPDCPISGKIPFNSWPTKYVLAIPGGRCWISEHLNPAVITQDNFVLIDASYEYGFQPGNFNIFTSEHVGVPEVIKGSVAVIAGHGSWNYYHWMMDVLPKLGLIENSGLRPDFYYLLCSESPFEKEALTILGIEKERIICAKKNQHIKAETLIVPSILSLPNVENFIDMGVPSWSLQFLREKFLKDTDAKKSLRIYVVRENTPWRKIVNDREVLDLLTQLNFIGVKLEEMSVVEQAKLFASAEIIVAAHGAGLANLAFCSSKTKVIEFVPESGVECTSCTPYFWCISQQLGLKHNFVICDQSKLSKKQKKFNQMLVNLPELKNKIEQLIAF